MGILGGLRRIDDAAIGRAERRILASRRWRELRGQLVPQGALAREIWDGYDADEQLRILAMAAGGVEVEDDPGLALLCADLADPVLAEQWRQVRIFAIGGGLVAGALVVAAIATGETGLASGSGGFIGAAIGLAIRPARTDRARRANQAAARKAGLA